jgi:phospholipase/carboxylesterase
MNDALIVHAPAGPPALLILLLHGSGADASDLVPLGERLAGEFANALIVSLAGAEAADLGFGRQWFSLREINEENRRTRVAAAMPGFLDTIRHWQQQSGVGCPGTALIGFSQGAIMALEATALAAPVAGRVVAIAGRFAALPEAVSTEVTLHLIHGKADPVIPYSHTVLASEHLIALGGDLTADVLPQVGHEITAEVEAVLLRRLKTYVPRRIWEEAMRQA